MAAGRDDNGSRLGKPEAAGASLRDEGLRLASFASGVSRESDRTIGEAAGGSRRLSGGSSRRGLLKAAEARGLIKGEASPGETGLAADGRGRRRAAALGATSRAVKGTIEKGTRRGLEGAEERIGLRPAGEAPEPESAPTGMSTGGTATSLSDAVAKRPSTLRKASRAVRRGITDAVNDEVSSSVAGDRETTLYAASRENTALSVLSRAGDGGVAKAGRAVKRFRTGRARLLDAKSDARAAAATSRIMAADKEGTRAESRGTSADEAKERLKKRASRRVTDYIRSTMSAGGTVTGHGLRLRLASTIRALLKTTASALSTAVGGVSASVAAAWPLVLIGLLLVLMFSGGWDGSPAGGNHGALSGVEAQVYDSLTAYGLSDTAIAGILGNMKAESGMDPSADADDGFGTVSMGLMQMVGNERTGFVSWCQSKGYQWSSVAAQMEWAFSGETGTSSYEDRWSSPGRVGDSYTSCPAYEPYFGSDYYKSGAEYKAATDVKLAAFSWMACYEGCATGWVSHLDNRIAYAQEYLDLIKQGGGSSAASDGNGDLRDKAIAAAKSLLGAPYVNADWGPGSDFSAGVDCNGLTYYAWLQAGIAIPVPSGHYAWGQFQWLKDSGNWVDSAADLQPGDLVFYSQDGGASTFHVALYIGDGQVIQSSHSTGVSIENLNWCSGFCGGGSPLGAPYDGSSSGTTKKSSGWDWWTSSSSGATADTVSGGQDYSSAESWQKGIVDACKSTPSPGSGLCAAWVSDVYNAAGVSQHGGNGNSMLDGNETSTDWSKIQVGQIVSAEKTASLLGQIYGHVGIYVGGGKVMDNIGYIRTTTLSEWVAEYGQYGWVKYGWPW